MSAADKRAKIIAAQAAREASEKSARPAPPPRKPRSNWAASASFPGRGGGFRGQKKPPTDE